MSHTHDSEQYEELLFYQVTVDLEVKEPITFERPPNPLYLQAESPSTGWRLSIEPGHEHTKLRLHMNNGIKIGSIKCLTGLTKRFAVLQWQLFLGRKIVIFWFTFCLRTELSIYRRSHLLTGTCVMRRHRLFLR